ncbi:MAG: hypothetical protein ACRC33_01730 [Gemmataceae bacterium]
MSPRFPDVPWPDPRFGENNARFPAEELWEHAGRHVAWSWDGTRLLASAELLEDLYLKLRELGIDPQRVVFDYVDPPDRGFLG